MARPTQGSGDGWAADRPVGGERWAGITRCMPLELVRENTQPLSRWEHHGEQENKTKTLLSGNGSWHGQHKVVMDGQPTD